MQTVVDGSHIISGLEMAQVETVSWVEAMNCRICPMSDAKRLERLLVDIEDLLCLLDKYLIQ